MGWLSDRWNSVTSTVSAAASSVTKAVVNTVSETASDLRDAAVEAVVETYDDFVEEASSMASAAYESAGTWVSDNVFADDTWVGKGMNWAADAGDKLSNMYDYMIENPERAFATIGEGLEEGIGYIVGTPGYLIDLGAEGVDWAYSSMTGAERSEGFGLGWGNAIASGVDQGFDHVQAASTYAINNGILGMDTTYAEALDMAEVKVLNEEEALLKGITIGALEVGVLAATAGGSGVARAGAWTARIAGKADDVVRLTNTGTRLSNTASRIGSAATRTAETASRPFRAAASIPGVAPTIKYAAVPGALFYLNVNGELSAYRVQELQERTAEMQDRMVEGAITGFQEREDYMQALLDAQTAEIDAMVDVFNSRRVSEDERAQMIARFEELEAQADLIEEWQNPDTTEARRQEIFTHLQERNAALQAEPTALETDGSDGTQEFNTNAEGVDPAPQDEINNDSVLDEGTTVEVKSP